MRLLWYTIYDIIYKNGCYMYKLISQLLIKEGISCFAPISLRHCKIKKQYLLDKAKIASGTAVIMAVPYFTPDCIGSAVSAYAVSRDYHLFFSELFSRILPILKENFPNTRFAGFADHSPIAEVEAAAAAGLGVIGKNGLLITEKYSSLVFIGEIILDAELTDAEPQKIKSCENCGICRARCPMKSGRECLSAVSQKKGELTDDDKNYIREYGAVFGCDICQLVCPHTKKAISEKTVFTEIPFFRFAPLPSPSAEDIKRMSDGEFALRAYSWRGRECIVRNLNIINDP